MLCIVANTSTTTKILRLSAIGAHTILRQYQNIVKCVLQGILTRYHYFGIVCFSYR